MTTDKRDRQRARRASRMAEAEAEAHQRRTRSRIIAYVAAALVIIVVIVGIAAVTGDDDPDTSSGGEDSSQSTPTDDAGAASEPAPAATEPAGFAYGSGTCPAADGSDGTVLDFSEPQPLCIDPSGDYVAVFDTSEGEIRIDLDTESVPGTVNNFVTLARWGYYDDTLLFRTDPSIDIIQGGSPHTNSASDPGPGYTISDEPAFDVGADGQPTGPYRYEPGQLVMARSFGVNSASAQFFFTTGPDAALLNGQGTYVVFGTADDAGLAVLESIIGLHVDDPSSGLGGGPSREVTINSVTVEAA